MHLHPTASLRKRQACLLGMCVLLLLGLALGRKHWSTAGLAGYEKRARPELILGVDKITRRNAAFLQMGLLKVSPDFCTAEELAASSPQAVELYGAPCPAPDPQRLEQGLPPSTALLPEVQGLDPRLTVVSVVCRATDLFDPAQGIVSNALETGREWERTAWLSARRGTELLVESPIGLRIHGGYSRKVPEKGFRLVFHRDYSGFPVSPPGLFFGAGTPPASTFVLSNVTHYTRFNGALATEIAGLAGCHVSRSEPAVLYLNGTPIKAPFFLYQHQTADFVRRRFGLKNIDWVHMKAREPEDNAAYVQWRRWVRRERYPISMAEEAARFDLSELSAWVLAMTFTVTTDNNQGGYFRDRDDPAAVWHTTAWDLDRAFDRMDYVVDGREINYSERPFEALGGERARLFFRLIEGSAEYRDYFRNFVRDKFNTTLGPANLNALVDRYVAIARMHPYHSPIILVSLEQTREFLATRHDTYLQQLEERLTQAEETHKSRDHDHSLAGK